MTIPDPQGLQRLGPALPPQAYKTYQVLSPQRPATCQEAGCQAYLRGWQTVVDESAELGQRQAAYIRQDRSRRHQESRRADGLTVFDFEAGQKCFASHRLPWEGRARFIERGGNWWAVTSEAREHNAETWVDSFANHQQRLADRMKEG